MSKHIFFIDPLEKLNTKKDSTLLLATSLKKRGEEVYLLLEDEFYVENKKLPHYKCFDFHGEFLENDFYLKNFEKKEAKVIALKENDVFHMRLDPPFDTRYLKYLWMQKFLKDFGVKVINDPVGILSHNEKLHAYTQKNSIPSFIGSSYVGLEKFLTQLDEKYEALIMKPLDLFQGIGVEKIIRNPSDIKKAFERKVLENGSIIVQPFMKEVAQGEIRSIYFKGQELGSILKVPKSGEFLANIAQGASYHGIELSEKVKKECNRIAKELNEVGVPWIAYDILGENVSEINITCPGLLVEVSHAHNSNMADKIADLL